MFLRGEGCIAGETQAGFSFGFSLFPSHTVLYRFHTSPSFVRFCIEIVMKINTDTQPLDATGEDLPSGRENVAVSAFCFYGFFFFFFFVVKKSLSGDIFSQPGIREPGNDGENWGNSYRLSQYCLAGLDRQFVPDLEFFANLQDFIHSGMHSPDSPRKVK